MYKLYKHINCTDIAARMLHRFYIRKKDGFKVKVEWVNVVNSDKFYNMNCKETIFIKSRDMKNWKEIEDPVK